MLQIQCKICEEVLKISQSMIGKQGICPQCFQVIQITSENFYSETIEQFAIRLKKKGTSPKGICEKLLESGFTKEDVFSSLKKHFSSQDIQNIQTFLFSDEPNKNLQIIQNKWAFVLQLFIYGAMILFVSGIVFLVIFQKIEREIEYSKQHIKREFKQIKQDLDFHPVEDIKSFVKETVQEGAGMLGSGTSGGAKTR